MRNIRIILLISVLLASFSLKTVAQSVVRYPQAGGVFTKHHRYPVELLELALSYQSDQHRVVPSEHFMTQGRAVEQLKQNKDIDILWTMTSEEREAKIRPIRIPIYMGLIGWRLFLTTTEQLNKRQNRWDIQSLKQANIIQGHDWPDIDILTFNDFNVVKGSTYQGLFKILSLNRANLFPRSIIEIWDELDDHRNTNITLEPDILISYPTATYFFVSATNNSLAELIEDGLRKANADGQFTKLFNKYYSDAIKKANLDKRIHFRLTNPLLPEATGLGEKALWFSLDQD